MEGQTKSYFVVPIFNSDMERVQFLSIYKDNIFSARSKEDAENKMRKMEVDTHKRGITCTFKIVSKTLLTDYNQ